VQLTDRDRKLLWGRAGSRCSYCRCRLVVEASDLDRESIVGDEAHIISDSPTGPRAHGGSRDKLDTYDNAILLCKTHHKMIDDQSSSNTADDLRMMKAVHERWVDQALSAAEKAQAAVVADLAVVEREPRVEWLRQMDLFGPSRWCPTPDANGPELTLRCVVAMPAPVLLSPLASGIAVSQLDAEARESLLSEALEAAKVTADVRAQASIWGWDEDLGWKAQGGTGSDELTRLTLDLKWPRFRIRQPVSVSAAVLTGVTANERQTGQVETGMVVAVDLSLNLIELDEHRRPSDIAYRTTPSPAPAALTLTELAGLMSSLVTISDLAPAVSSSLLGRTVEDRWMGLWLRLSSVELERVVQLNSLDRLGDALRVSNWSHIAACPATTADAQRGGGALVREFLTGLLKRSDYRRFAEALDEALEGAP
jgi:hypothetical protein